jgi:hypothetical protein
MVTEIDEIAAHFSLDFLGLQTLDLEETSRFLFVCGVEVDDTREGVAKDFGVELVKGGDHEQGSYSPL